jgi:hypothetical protein
MMWLTLQILVYLAIAFVLGGVVAWLLRGLVAAPVVEAAPAVAPLLPGEDLDRARLLRERERVLAERDRVVGERDGYARERDALVRERDGLARELEETRSLVARLEQIIESEHAAAARR